MGRAFKNFMTIIAIGISSVMMFSRYQFWLIGQAWLERRQSISAARRVTQEPGFLDVYSRQFWQVVVVFLVLVRIN